MAGWVGKQNRSNDIYPGTAGDRPGEASELNKALKLSPPQTIDYCLAVLLGSLIRGGSCRVSRRLDGRAFVGDESFSTCRQMY
eukprot:scaffold20016_cov60-Cyclotella_meneghiniana.AAC.2